MSPIVQVILTSVLSVATCGGLWTYLDHRRAERGAAKRQYTEEEKAERDLLRGLARLELIRVSMRFIDAGSITMEEADALTELYEPYSLLGGNGNGKRLYEQAIALPRRTGRTADRREAAEDFG